MVVRSIGGTNIILLAALYGTREASKRFGNLVRDAQYDNLYHIAACDEGSCFAFDFGFTDVASFETDDGDEGANLQPPRVQMAFSYCARPSVDDSAAAQPMVKRLRVQTVEFGVARTPVRCQRCF